MNPYDTDHAASLVPLDQVRPAEVHWLWKPVIPLGKVTVVDGDTGLGKSLMMLDVAARASTGRAMPDGTAGLRCGVCILSAEDGVADTIVPRLKVAGADLRFVQVLTEVRDVAGGRPLTLPRDAEVLECAVGRTGCRLLIVDPLAAYLGRGVDAGSDQDMRYCLHRLAKVAERTGCALVLLRSLGKIVRKRALYRGAGSIGIIAAARSGLLVASDPADPDGHILACTKANLTRLPPSLRFRVEEDEHGMCRVVWHGTSPLQADDLLCPPPVSDPVGALETACDMLKMFLAAGPQPQAQCRVEAQRLGIAWVTLVRAKYKLGVRSVRQVFGPGQWVWELPTNTAQAAAPLGEGGK